MLLMPLLVVFIVGTANFYNFMDGINGISGITGIIGFGMIAFYALNFGNSSSFIDLGHLYVNVLCGFSPIQCTKS